MSTRKQIKGEIWENWMMLAQKESEQNKTDPILCIGLLKQMHEKLLDPNHP